MASWWSASTRIATSAWTSSTSTPRKPSSPSSTASPPGISAPGATTPASPSPSSAADLGGRGGDGFDLDEPAGFQQAGAHDGAGGVVGAEVPFQDGDVGRVEGGF